MFAFTWIRGINHLAKNGKPDREILKMLANNSNEMLEFSQKMAKTPLKSHLCRCPRAHNSAVGETSHPKENVMNIYNFC